MGFKDFKKKQNTKFKKLPRNFQVLLSWYSWLEYDFKNNELSQDYYTYENFRHWCIQELDEWYDMDESEIPKIESHSAFLKTWFDLDNKINKASLRSVVIGRSYDIKPAYDGLYLSEICITNK